VIHREHEGDVHIDSLANQLLDGGDALLRGGHLDHQVGPVNGRPEAPRLLDGAVRVAGEVRRDLQAHEPVAVGFIEHRAHDVAGALDIGDGDLLIQVRRVGIRVLLDERLQVVVVFLRAADGFLEDRRVGRHPAQVVLVDQLLKLAARHEAAADVVEPEGLAAVAEGVGRCHGWVGCVRFGLRVRRWEV
jgi:hypothetical protein